MLRRFDKEKRRAIDEEIKKLLASGFMKEFYHLEWLANLVLVKRSGKRKMCVVSTRHALRIRFLCHILYGSVFFAAYRSSSRLNLHQIAMTESKQHSFQIGATLLEVSILESGETLIYDEFVVNQARYMSE